MTLDELIEKLQKLRDEHGGCVQVEVCSYDDFVEVNSVEYSGATPYLGTPHTILIY